MVSKLCPKCGVVKSLNDFYNKKSTKDKHTCYCKECCKKDRIKYFSTHKAAEIKRNNKYIASHLDEIKRWHKENRNTQEYKDYFNGYCRERLKNPIHKLEHSIRVRMGQALRGLRKTLPAKELLGCDLKELKVHIEAKFSNGMTWKNYGKWHIDHKRPCASFDLSKLEEQKECFGYLNLQPLWAEDNLTKSKKEQK